MSRSYYPPWYALPRGVELRLDGTAALPRPAVKSAPSGPPVIPLFGLIFGIVAGVMLTAGWVFLHLPTGASADAGAWLLTSDAGRAALTSGLWPYAGLTGGAVAAIGLYLAKRTRCLEGTSGLGFPMRALLYLYVAPGAAVICLAAGMAILIVVLVFAMGIGFVLAAIIAAAGSDR